MQRSLPYQNALSSLLLLGLFVVYISLSSIYLLLPPLAAILFFAYHDALNRHDLFTLVVISGMLLFFEAEKGFWFGSTIIFFTLMSRTLIPKLEQTLQCRFCMAALFVAISYPGYWLFIWISNQVLMLGLPALDWHMGLYAVVEFLILSAFV